jgi:acetyltransferase
MTIRNFEFLLRPRSVALIGASAREGSVGLITARNLCQGGFAGPVWLVNPKYHGIEGVPCFPSLAALPAPPDLAVLVTPPATLPQLIAELGDRGTRAAVIITAGIRAELRQSMLDAARKNLMRIQGPNCLGLMLPGLGLNASFSQQAPLAGDLAFLSQSGALITAIIDWAGARNIGFSQIVSLGDMADVDFGDMLDYLAADTASRAILLYMESVTDAPKFMSAARRAARSKPVIVVKAGRSTTGAKAAMSHTGAMAGSDAAYEAAFRRAGVLRVRELNDLFNAAEILARHPQLVGDRLGILTNGGGAGVLATDHLGELGGRLANLSEAGKMALDGLLPTTWSHANPVDIIGDADPGRYARVLDVLMDEEEMDAILVMHCPTALTSSGAVARELVRIRQQRKDSGRRMTPLLANWLGAETSRGARDLFAQEGIASFLTPAEAIDGFMQLVRYSRAQEQLMRTPPTLPEDLELDSAQACSLMSSVVASARSSLTEVEAGALLKAYGIPVVESECAANPVEVGAVARRLIATHGACVLKILSEDISHKSDVGGVRLGLERAEEAQRTAEDMLERVARLAPAASIKGFTLQPMIRRSRAHELIVGMSVDATFGPLMMFGAGGTAVEVVKDTAHALPPLDLDLARDLMRHTRVWSLLQGYRDCPAVAVDRIAEILVRLSYLVAHHSQIREIEINPLIADDKVVLALDARVRVADAHTSPRVAMAIRPYPSQWQIDTQIETIGPLRIRPIRPQDEALYAEFFAHVSLEDRRLRFFSAAIDLSHRFLARLTQIDYAREMAFVAIAKNTGALLAVVRAVADPDYVRCEYAIQVRSDLKGRGLGWRLMQHLIAYARAEGLEELHGCVLSENTVMLQMCRELGFSVQPEPGDPGVRRVALNLAGAGAP